MALLADFGTSWTKYLDTEQGSTRIMPSREVGGGLAAADLATGHNARLHARRCVNELSALARGAYRLLGVDGPVTVLDVGSRDMKYVRMEGETILEMDWNATCGALTGFSLELLGRYFDADFAAIAVSDRPLPVTCGLIGMEQLFDRMAAGEPAEGAVASFAAGLARLAHDFARRPAHIHLSGGMCDNPLFVRSLEREATVTPLGRFVLLSGLLDLYAS